MKKICLIIDSLGGGGAENNLLKIADLLTQRNCRVHVIITENIIEYPVPESIGLHILSEKRKITGIKYLDRKILASRLRSKIKELERSGKIDLTVAFLWRSHMLSKMAGLRAVFFSIRNTLSQKKLCGKGWQKAIARMRVRHLYNHQNILGVSRGVVDDLVASFGVKPKTAKVIYNPFNIEAIREKACIPNPSIPKFPFIVHVGSFRRAKRQDILVRAYHMAGITSHKLVFVGKGAVPDVENIKSMVQNSDLEGQVVFAGWQSNPMAWLQNADLLVLSSDYEGLPTVLIEALILGTPVVSTDCPSGPSEILRGPLRDYLAPVNDVAALAAKMVQALRYYPAIQDKILDPFRADNIVEQYLSLDEK